MSFDGVDNEERLGFVGILVCQPQSVLDHKLRDGREDDGCYCYWEFASDPELAKKRFPKRIRQLIESFETTGSYSEVRKAPGGGYEDDDLDFTDPYGFYVRLYFAVGGIVRGFFKCYAADQERTQLRFRSDDWVPVKSIKVRPSQGYRYFSHNGAKKP